MANRKYQHTVQESPATTGEVEKDTSKVAWVSWRRQVQKCTKMEEICAVRLVAVDRKHTHQTKVVSSGKTNTVKLKYQSQVQVKETVTRSRESKDLTTAVRERPKMVRNTVVVVVVFSANPSNSPTTIVDQSRQQGFPHHYYVNTIESTSIRYYQ